MRNGFFEDTDILAADLQAAGRALMTNGVLLDEADALKVIAAGGMKVAIKTGTAWLNGAYVTNEATAALTLTTADGVLNRIDRIVIRRDDIQGQIYGVVLTGVAAATPIPPAIVRDGTYYDLCLATIAVNAGTTTITDAMITDNRGDATLCPVACARTGILAKIETKADKTYCDNTFATKTEITVGTLKANADRLLGKIINLSRTGVLINNASGITVLNPGVILANSTVSQAWRTITIGMTNPGYTIFKFSYNDPNTGDIYKDTLITIGELNGLVISVPASGGTGYVTITLTDSTITLTLNMNTYLNCTIKLVGLF